MTNKNLNSSTNDGYNLQISSNSSLSNDSDISSFSFDKEVSSYTNRLHSDELPAFEIRLISPLGRSPSPIDTDFDLDQPPSPTHSCITPTRKLSIPQPPSSGDFIPLHDINAQISPPSDSAPNSPLNNNLETIFEGVFLNTPPRPKPLRKSTGFGSANNRNNFMERAAINRINSALGKENLTNEHKISD